MIHRLAIFAALLLAGCAQPVSGPEPTIEATPADRQAFSRTAKFRTVCRDDIGIKPPRFGFIESGEKCDCFHDWMAQNFDGKIVAWAVQYPDWWDRRLPAWAESRLSGVGGMNTLTTRALAACNIKATP